MYTYVHLNFSIDTKAYEARKQGKKKKKEQKPRISDVGAQ